MALMLFQFIPELLIFARLLKLFQLMPPVFIVAIPLTSVQLMSAVMVPDVVIGVLPTLKVVLGLDNPTEVTVPDPEEEVQFKTVPEEE